MMIDGGEEESWMHACEVHAVGSRGARLEEEGGGGAGAITI